MNRIKETWRKDNWFKLTIISFVILLMMAIILQNVIGANSMSVGNPILHQEEVTLSANTIQVYSVNFSSEYNGFHFSSKPKVELYVFERTISPSPIISEIANDAIEHKTSTDSFGMIVEGKTAFSVVIITPDDESVLISYDFREYTKTDISKIQYWSIGSLIMKIAFIPIILFVIIRFAIPWYRKRKSKRISTIPQMQSPQNSNFCQKCGSEVRNQKFCQKCGSTV